ncbi:MAG: hypothetical protein ACLGIC_09075 [Acidimicrobiia bacterium]
MIPLRSLPIALLAGALLLGCTGDDGDDAAPSRDDATEDGGTSTPAPRFCDVFLDYLAEPSGENLDAVVTAADDPRVDELAGIISEDDRTGRVLAADSDLQALARERCQAEWIGAAQGGGDTAGAAQALLDALAAGDRLGAANVASANAIAAFEPWEPIEPDPQGGTPTLLTIGERTFTMALDADRIAECQVEAGVVISCTVVE